MIFYENNNFPAEMSGKPTPKDESPMVGWLEDLTVDEQVERMKHISNVIADIVKTRGGKMLVRESRLTAAETLKTTVDQVDYGLVYGESTRTLSIDGIYINA
jgi:hypothetical protein